MTRTATDQQYDIERAVLDRYQKGAHRAEPALCCPAIDYDDEFLKVIPQEIREKDYGCGDPSNDIIALREFNN